MSEGIYTEAPLALRAWLKSIIGDAVVYADHARRFTLTVNDIILSLKKNGATLYGYTYYEKRERLTRKLPASILVRKAAPATGVEMAAEKATEKTRVANTPRATTRVAIASSKIAVSTPSDTPMAVSNMVCSTAFGKDTRKAQAKMTGGGRNRKASRLGVSVAQNAKTKAMSVTPQRASDIQKSLSTFRDTVIERQKEACTTSERMQDWVAAHMLGRGKTPCTSDEMDIVLGALIEKDAIMRADGKVYFV